MSSFHIGQEVVCIKKDPWVDEDTLEVVVAGPRRGDVLIIDDIVSWAHEDFLVFARYPGFWWPVYEFRPVAKTDISVFTAMLAKAPQPETVYDDGYDEGTATIFQSVDYRGITGSDRSARDRTRLDASLLKQPPDGGDLALEPGDALAELVEGRLESLHVDFISHCSCSHGCFGLVKGRDRACGPGPRALSLDRFGGGA